MPAAALIGGVLLLVQLITMTPIQLTPEQTVRLNDRASLTHDALFDELAQKRFVLVGESHDDAEHHRVQLAVIQALHQRRGDIAIGMEMFPRHLQPQLDRWVAGELDESAFLDAVEWYFTWGFEAELYLPILRYARDNHIPVIALNVKRELISSVRKQGLENLDPEIAKQLPPVEPPNAAYRALLNDFFSQHGRAMGGMLAAPQAFDRFMEAQSTWDAVFANGLIGWTEQHPNGAIVGVMGMGHLRGKQGVTRQLDARGFSDHAIVLPWTVTAEWINPNDADYAWGTPEAPEGKEPVRLGILLAEPAAPTEGAAAKPDAAPPAPQAGVGVEKVTPYSIAEQSGFKDGDRITAINAQNVASRHALVRMIRALNWGDAATITILRDGAEQSLAVTLPKEPPPPMGPHGKK
ncbi:ChaN family lipoprotein [Magnetofaba australis]|uniref:PDZ domain-containing protein n=1 Tax=Magnetofaba australis IT-1 TaxID=1434232 RepID=A0A1Y2K798_9PROT|nr:ChaN family lipoprotein [Magnetofaba australis]OSM04242.1 hypothetical protein MAIT1_04108 [Magnetofaba australis IT-1]